MLDGREYKRVVVNEGNLDSDNKIINPQFIKCKRPINRNKSINSFQSDKTGMQPKHTKKMVGDCNRLLQSEMITTCTGEHIKTHQFPNDRFQSRGDILNIRSTAEAEDGTKKSASRKGKSTTMGETYDSRSDS